MHLELFSTHNIVRIEKLTIVFFYVCVFSLVYNRCTVDPRYLFQSFSITWEGYIINYHL